MKKNLPYIFLLLLMGFVFSSCCHCESDKDGRYVYSVKFICGEQFFGGLPQPADVARMPGHYATSINVHNPNLDSVVFLKKAILLEEGRPQGQGPKSQTPQAPGKKVREFLLPNWAMQMVCYDVQVLLGSPDPNIPISPAREGYVVFETDKPLDVTAVYTYKNLRVEDGGYEGPGIGGVGASIDVEYIRATKTKQ